MILIPLDRTAKLNLVGVEVPLRYPGKLLSPKPTPKKTTRHCVLVQERDYMYGWAAQLRDGS